MERILWAQGEAPERPSAMVIDGMVCDDAEVRQRAFGVLTSRGRKPVLAPRERERLVKEGMSGQTNYAEGDGWIYMQGCYSDVDRGGRRMAYMYCYTGSGGMDEARRWLEADSALIGRKCDLAELRMLGAMRDELKKKSVGSAGMWAACSAAVVLIVMTILWLMLN